MTFIRYAAVAAFILFSAPFQLQALAQEPVTPSASPSEPVNEEKLKELFEDLKDAIDDTAEIPGRKFTTKTVNSTKIVLTNSGNHGRVSFSGSIEIPWKNIKQIGLRKSSDGEIHFLALQFHKKLESSFTTGAIGIAPSTMKEMVDEERIPFSKRKDVRAARDIIKDILKELHVVYVEKDEDQ